MLDRITVMIANKQRKNETNNMPLLKSRLIFIHKVNVV
jgi:hypothetical protein